MGHRPLKGEAKRTPLKAIRAYYLSLQNGSAKLVREQPLGYPCDPWRFGRRPFIEATYYDDTDEARWFPWLAEENKQAPSSTFSDQEDYVGHRVDQECSDENPELAPELVDVPACFDPACDDLSQAPWVRVCGDVPGIPRDQQHDLLHLVIDEDPDCDVVIMLCGAEFPTWRVRKARGTVSDCARCRSKVEHSGCNAPADSQAEQHRRTGTGGRK